MRVTLDFHWMNSRVPHFPARMLILPTLSFPLMWFVRRQGSVTTYVGSGAMCVSSVDGPGFLEEQLSTGRGTHEAIMDERSKLCARDGFWHSADNDCVWRVHGIDCSLLAHDSVCAVQLLFQPLQIRYSFWSARCERWSYVELAIAIDQMTPPV